MVAVEEAVEIEKVVAAAVVVLVAMLCTILRIPDTLNVRKGRGSGLVHLLYQPNVHLFTVAHPLRFDLQSLVEQIVMAGNDVYKVTDTSRRVVGSVQVDVDAAGRVGERSRFAETPHKPLQSVDVLPIEQHRADQFHTVFLVCWDYSPMFFR